MKYEKLAQNIEQFCNNLDNEYQVDFVRRYAEIGDSKLYGGKYCGSDAEHEGARFIAEELRKIGVPKVEIAETPTTRYQFNDATIEVLSETSEKMEIKPFGYVSPGTGKDGICAELVDTKYSSRDFYDNNDVDVVKGKIALIEGMGVLEGTNLAGQMEEAINHGAKAIIIYMTEDVLNEDTIRVQPPNLTSTVPIVGISIRHTNYLKGLLEKGKVEIRLTVDAEFDPKGGTTLQVIGEIPGEKTEEKIAFSAHLDHYFRCLQDNMASCAMLLGTAKAMVDIGYKPRRGIMFVFHGSHECGLSDSRYAYISGSYKLTRKKPEWKGKVLADINFEYAALKLDTMAAITTLCIDDSVKEYMKYAPEFVGGFKTLSHEIDRSLYYMMSWCDGVSWHTNGTPVVTNDVITQQMTTGNSPYVGRDHSNFDNWDSFSNEALEDTTRFYGGYGFYLDNMPYLELNFSEQAERVANEVKMDIMEQVGVSTDEYRKQADLIEQTGKKLLQLLKEANERFASNPDEGQYAIAEKINAKTLETYDLLQKGMEKIIAEDFFNVGSGRYSQNIFLLNSAIEALEAGNAEKALKEYILPVDLCAASYHFGPEVVEHMRKQISDKEYDDRRTWALGRELECLKLYDTVQSLKKTVADGNSGDFTAEIAEIKEAIKLEVVGLKKTSAEEVECLVAANRNIKQIIEMLA